MSLWFERVLTSEGSISQGHFMGGSLSSFSSSLICLLLWGLSSLSILNGYSDSSLLLVLYTHQRRVEIWSQDAWIWIQFLSQTRFRNLCNLLNPTCLYSPLIKRSEYYLLYGFLWRLTDLILGWTSEIAMGVSKWSNQPYIWPIP